MFILLRIDAIGNPVHSCIESIFSLFIRGQNVALASVPLSAERSLNTACYCYPLCFQGF